MSFLHHVGPYPFTSSGKDLKAVPLRSSSSVREKVSTDTNTKSVKTAVTVTTSRQAGQRVINKSTLTTTTTSNTKGIVVTGRPEHSRVEESPTKSIISKSNEIGVLQSEKYRPCNYSNNSNNNNVKDRQMCFGKSTPQKQRKLTELEKVEKQRLVETLAKIFEEPEPSMDEGWSGNNNNHSNDDCCDKNKPPEKLSWRYLLTDYTAPPAGKNDVQRYKFAKDDRGMINSLSRLPPKDKELTKPPINDSLTLTEKTQMNTFTFSLPRSSLFKVSSKQLKSVLESSADTASVTSPPLYTENCTSGVVIPDYGRLNSVFRGDVENTSKSSNLSTSEASGIASGGHSVELRGNNLHPVNRGLDYGRIWGSVLDEVDRKPRPKVTCYKDYLAI